MKEFCRGVEMLLYRDVLPSRGAKISKGHRQRRQEQEGQSIGVRRWKRVVQRAAATSGEASLFSHVLFTLVWHVSPLLDVWGIRSVAGPATRSMCCMLNLVPPLRLWI